MSQRYYLAIDLKSFYASVECIERELDPMTTNLTVADASRTDKTICLAVSPSLKAFGIPGLTTPDEISSWVKSLGSEWFNICLDTGHSAITGIEPEDMIRTIGGEMIKAVHIHDNDRLGDLHLLPFEGKLNWDNITGALKDIDYEGDFTLESTNFFTGVPDNLIPASLKYAEETGRYLISKIKD